MTEREEFEAKEGNSDDTEEEVYHLTQPIEDDKPNDQLDLIELQLDANPRTQSF